MVRTLLTSAREAGQATTAGATEYWFLANCFHKKSSTENNRKIPYRTAGILRDLYVTITANSTSSSSTIVTRKNGADGNLSITIGAAATGVFEDSVNTDTVAAGDLLNYKTDSGGTGTFSTTIMSVIFSATTNTVSKMATEDTVVNVANATRRHPIAGEIAGGGTGETVFHCTVRKAGTMKNFATYADSNARVNTTTFLMRKNAANTTITFSIGAGATGLFEDSTNTSSVAADDEVNYQYTTGAGTESLSLQYMSIEYETTTGHGFICAGAGTAQGVNPAITEYYPISGIAGSRTDATESIVTQKARATFTLSNISTNIDVNGVTATSTIRSRVNGANGNQVLTIGSGATGIFTDSTNTDSVTPNDEINYVITTGATGTTINIRQLAMWTFHSGIESFIRVPSSDSTTVTDSSLTRIKSAARIPTTDTITVSDSSLTRIKTKVALPSADSTTVADGSLTRRLSGVRSPSTDTTVVGENLTRNTQAFRTVVTENIIAQDSSLTRLATKSRVPSADSITAQDSSTTKITTRVRVPSTDTTTVTAGTATRQTQAFRSPSSDTVTPTDVSTTRIKTMTRIPSSDSTVVAESSLTRLLQARRVPSTDSQTVTEASLTRSRGLPRVPASDSTVVTDVSITSQKTMTRVPGTETTTVVDSSLTRMLSLIRLPTTEVPALSENLTRMLSALRLLSVEVITTNDNATRTITQGAATYERSPSADNTTVADASLVRVFSALRVPATEIVSSIDATLSRVLSLFRSPSLDSVTTNDDNRTRNITISRIPSSDSTAVTDGTLNRVLSAARVPSSDTVTAVDSSLVRMLQLVRLVSTDTVTTSESVGSTVSGRISRNVSDTVDLAENLTRILSARRIITPETVNLNEQLTRIRSLSRIVVPDSTGVSDASLTRSVAVTRSASDTPNVVESAITRVLSAFRSILDTTIVSELQSAVSHYRRLEEIITVTEPVIARIVTAIRSVTPDIVDVDESVFYQALHKYVFDTVIIAEQLFTERELLSGPTTYATPAEVRPLLGNLGDQRTDTEIALAVAAAYDQINRKTNRLPPDDWKDTDADWDIIKKLARYIAALEMSIGIKDFQDRELMQKEIDSMFMQITENTPGDSTTDIVEASQPVTYASNETGIIWSQRYPNLRKRSTGTDNQQYSSIYD